MVTLRLDQKLEQDLNNTAKKLGLSKSELIRKSIQDYITKQKNPDAWEVGKDLFGKYSSGYGDLSTRRKDILKEKIRAKRT
jgi:RHH-type transcriptional regulator, rel operon repressor / antitoxin RelB